MKKIEELANRLYVEVLEEYNAIENITATARNSATRKKSLGELLDEKMAGYNAATKEIIEGKVFDAVGGATAFKSLPPTVLSGVKLSDTLYKNSANVARESVEILNQGINAKSTIKNMSMKLYNGYDFNDKEVLSARRKLPKYLQRELKRGKTSKELIKYIDNLQTKPLKTALNQIIGKMDSINKVGLEKALKVALEEKSRYYATRIADTESHRARNLSRAKEFFDDEDVEFVKYTMSSRHPMTDICDYYASLDVGYGAGIVPKEQMITLPNHPWCKCRYHPHYHKPKKQHIKNPETHTMDKFSLRDQQRIAGSFDKLRQFKEGASLESVFNSVRPHYPIKLYTDVFWSGYNSNMKKFIDKYPRNKFGYEVGTVSVILSEILLSETRTVTISGDTLKKNLNHHPDLSEDDYLQLDEIVGKSHFVAKDGDRTVAIMLNKNNRELYHYALKSTLSGKQLFLTSFRKTRQKSIERLRKKGKENKIKIIKDNLP